MNLLRNAVKSLSVVVLLAVAPQVGQALPILFAGDVFNNNGNVPGVGFSLIHEGATPSGSTLYTFNAGDPLTLYGEVTDPYAITLDDKFSLYGGPVTYSLNGGGGAATFELTDLFLQVGSAYGALPLGYVDAYGNDIDPNSFYEIGGFASYTLTDGSNFRSGTFKFEPTQYYATAFNGIALTADYTRSFFLWGGDQANKLGIDYAATITPVPEPASLALFGGGLALLGLVGIRRKRRSAYGCVPGPSRPVVRSPLPLPEKRHFARGCRGGAM